MQRRRPGTVIYDAIDLPRSPIRLERVTFVWVQEASNLDCQLLISARERRTTSGSAMQSLRIFLRETAILESGPSCKLVHGKNTRSPPRYELGPTFDAIQNGFIIRNTLERTSMSQ